MSFLDVMKTQSQGLQSMATVGVIGLHMVSGPVVGFAFGYFLDAWLGTGPYLKLILLFVGIGAGFLNVYRDTKALLARLDGKGREGTSSSPDGEGPGHD